MKPFITKAKRFTLSCGLIIGIASCANAAPAPHLIPLPQVERTPLVPRTLVFSRLQSQYNLYFNYLHYYTPEWYWIDRPLFFDKSLMPGDEFPGSELTNPSFARMMDATRPYEIDGFSHLTAMGSHQVTNYKRALELSSQRPNPLPILMEISAGGSNDIDKYVAHLSGLLDAALASPAAPRINGKVLISSYNLDHGSLENWKQIIATMHAKYGEKFIIVASIAKPWWPPYMSGEDGSIPPAELAELKSYLRSWLNVFDGIMYSAVGHATDPTNDNLLDPGFDEYIARVCNSVLSEPQYSKKYFGYSAAIGYFNPITASRSNANGTQYLRDSLRIALAANPDFIILPEWNEVNENTNIQPTVYNSFSSQRIIRHEMWQLKEEPLQPQQGDDISIPNLVISYRPFLALGEQLKVEVLNIPDGTAKSDFRLELCLKDIHHNTVKVLSPATLDGGTMTAKAFVIPTEELANHPVLMPSLQVTTSDGKTQIFEDGLMAIRLRPTKNWNYKWFRMPLRDLLQPISETFTAELPATNGSVKVQGNVETKNEIASVEVVADGYELHAVDPNHTWELKPDEALIMMYELAPSRIHEYDGKYFVTGGKVRKVNDQFAFWATRKAHETSGTLTWSPLGEIFIVDHKDTAVLHVENSIYKTAVPISKILEDGIYSEVHGRGVTLTIHNFHGVPEMPLPLNSTKSTFTTTVNPMRNATTLQMRVITKSGKIYRSWPVMVAPSKTGKISLPVYSETLKKPVTVQVDKSRIPHIEASPSRTHGAEIVSSDAPYFNGLVGGVPFWTYIARGDSRYPADASQTAPTRVTEDGMESWQFDGKGNFLYFPQETLPRGAFTLSFTFKPTSEKRQTLLLNRGYARGAFKLTLENGKLSATYTDQLRREEPYYHIIPLDPKLSVPLNQWSTVKIRYDLQNITFSVNGKSSKPIPLSTKGIKYTPLVFGGYGNGKYDHYFEGYLKELKIWHNG